jgi:hypothetical protein
MGSSFLEMARHSQESSTVRIPKTKRKIIIIHTYLASLTVAGNAPHNNCVAGGGSESIELRHSSHQLLATINSLANEVTRITVSLLFASSLTEDFS